jgi:hypothetical protein
MGHGMNHSKNTWAASVKAVGFVNGFNQLFDFARSIRVPKSAKGLKRLVVSMPKIANFQLIV